MRKKYGMMLGVASVMLLIGAGCATTDTNEENEAETTAVVEETMEKDDAMVKDDMEKDKMMEEETMDTIADLAVATDDLSTLVTALDAANLVSVFADEDAEFTVFAPTNEAFADIQETVDTLLQEENVDDLANVLQYHVVEGAVMAADLSDGMEVTMLNGDSATVSIDDDGTVMVGDATVTTADVKAANGVVHIIDTVLVP